MELEFLEIIFLCFFFIVFFIILIVGFKKFGHKYARNNGEIVVAKFLSCLPKEYKIYNNLLLPSSKNGTTEVDHVVVSPYRIFVIETKDYYGKVEGTREQKYWIQNTGFEIKKVGNPLNQNYGHMKSVQEITHVKFDDMVSIVVFTGNAELPNISLKDEYVVELNELLPIIYSYKKEIFKPWFQNKIMKRLEKNNSQGLIAGIKHTVKVRRTH